MDLDRGLSGPNNWSGLVEDLAVAGNRTSACILFSVLTVFLGTWWRSWVRHSAIKNVAGSIPDGVIGIFPSGRTITLGLTHHLTEMSTRDTSWGSRRLVRRADNHATFMCPMSGNSVRLNLLET
jgi:hypothetical protein